MAQDFTDLETTEAYDALLTHIGDRDVALALAFDPAYTTPINVKTRTVRWNSANGYWEYYNGSVWVQLASTYNITVTKANNVTGGAAGNLLYQSAADVTAKLAAGTNGYMLTMASGNPAWVAQSTLAVGSATNASQLGGVAAASYAQIANITGKESIWVPAGAMSPRITNGPAVGLVETAANKIQLATLDFDQATAEYAQFQIHMPKSWNEGTLTAVVDWSSAISGSNAAVWALRAVAISDDDVLDAAFGTAVSVTDAQTAVGDLMKTAETGAMTIAGTPAAGDMVVFEVYRDAANGSDTLAGDARLHGVMLFYTTDALNDA